MTEKNTIVTYWAVSVLTSRTVQFAALTVIVGILALPEVVDIIPLRWMPFITAIVGIGNFLLRLITVRPVAFIAPGSSIPVEVSRVGPPAPPIITD